MKLATILQIIALCSLLLGGGWLARDYELDHKPKANEMWADYKLRVCLTDCEESQLTVCKGMQVPEERCPVECDDQCDKYRQVEK